MQPDRKHKEKQNDDIIASNPIVLCVCAYRVAFYSAPVECSPHLHANPSHVT